MKYFNNLKLGLRLGIIFGIIILVGLWGMIKINKELSVIKKGFVNTIETKLVNEKNLTDAERFVFQCHIELEQAILLIETNQKSRLTGTTGILKNINSAKEKITFFDQRLRSVDGIKYDNLSLMLNAFTKYEETVKRLSAILLAAESYASIENYYVNNYLPAFNSLRSAMLAMSVESVSIMENNFKTSEHFVDRAKTSSFIVLLLIIIVLIIGGIILERSIIAPLIETRNFIENLSRGELPDNLAIQSKDEIGEIISVLNQHVANLKQTAIFAKQIGEGKFNIDYKPLSEKDLLGNALLEMKKGLQLAKEEELKRKAEDDKRNWATQGLAKFADILRKDNDNLDKLANDVISNLIAYIDANQGGLFMYNDDDPSDVHLSLIASFAFNRKKFQTKKIIPGEGLVGTCAIEKQTIYMTEIPDDYIEITSGLGEANPRSLLIVPLKLEDKIFGVLELASFHKFEPYQIEFVEKIGESIAATLSSVKINEKTAALLAETKLQAEEMLTKEEEMRQNLEELKATQEEMERIKQREQEKTEQLLKENEEFRKMLVRILDTIPGKIFLKDKDGKFLIVNSAVAKAHQSTTDELIGLSDYDLYDYNKAKEYYAEEVEIMHSEAKSFIEEDDKGDERRIVKTTKMPFYIPHLKQTGLLGIQSDITEITLLHEKEKELQNTIARLQKEIEAIKSQNQK